VRPVSDSKLASEVAPVYVTSIGELVEVVTGMAVEGHVLWYRGHASADWDVLPSIWRRYSAAEERNLTNRFRSRAAIRYSSAPVYQARTSWLSLMQHYGLPTRLLDWTRSPLIAAYFALEQSSSGSAADCTDAAIWVLWPHRLNASQGFQPVTPSIDAYLCGKMIEPAFIDSATENDKILAAMSAETDMRIFVQQGCFTIHSGQTALNKLPGNSAFLRPVILTGGSIRQMALEIDACGFRRGDLFPDLGNLAEELKRSYPPESLVP
jgi:hypothetical protein